MQYGLFSLDLYYRSEWYKFKTSIWGKLREVLPIAELASLLPDSSDLGRIPLMDL